MFKRKWRWMCAAIIVFCLVGIAVFLQSKTEIQEPIKIYKAVTLHPKPSSTEPSTAETQVATSHSQVPNDGHNQNHSHGTGTHSHTAETSIGSSESDWRDDSAFESPSPKVDPWEQTYPEQASTEIVDDTYPPRDWYKTEDPALYIEYLQAQLIKQFGNIPEVHTFVAFEEKRKAGIPIKDAEEYLNFIKAQYSLWPEEITLKTLETLEKQIAEGENVVFGPMRAP